MKVGIRPIAAPGRCPGCGRGLWVFAVGRALGGRYRERGLHLGRPSRRCDAHRSGRDRPPRPCSPIDRSRRTTDLGEAIKLAARTHQSLIWTAAGTWPGCARRCGSTFPRPCWPLRTWTHPTRSGAVGKAPEPDQAARLSTTVISAALKRARRRRVEDRTQQLRTIFGAAELRQPPALQSAYAAVVASEVAIIHRAQHPDRSARRVVGEHFGRHRDAEIYLSLPRPRGDPRLPDPGRVRRRPRPLRQCEATQDLRRHLADHESLGHQEVVLARYARNRRLGDALQQWAFCSPRGSPRSKGLLPPAPRPQDRPRGRATTAREPLRRHPARLPQDPDHLRRTYCLVTPLHDRCSTSKNLDVCREPRGDADVRMRSQSSRAGRTLSQRLPCSSSPRQGSRPAARWG